MESEIEAFRGELNNMIRTLQYLPLQPGAVNPYQIELPQIGAPSSTFNVPQVAPRQASPTYGTITLPSMRGY
jgi:hypothetical protein